MKNLKKALVLFLCAVLLVAGSVMGTLAYLTAQDNVLNTFTVGEVAIDLWENKVDVNNNATTEITHTGNTYTEIQPGLSYVKNPTVTVKKDSENCYVRMMVKVTYKAEADAVLAKYNYQTWFDFNGAWTVVGAPTTEDDGANITRTYEFRYNYMVLEDTGADQDLPALFTRIEIPGGMTNAELLTLEGLQIAIDAHAIQADGFVDANEAWGEFTP